MSVINTFDLRRLLLLDAVTAALMGILLVLASQPLATLTAMPAGFLFAVGVLLLPLAAIMLAVAVLGASSPAAVWLVIGGNYAWVIASLIVMLGIWISPNLPGYVLIGVQAVVVLGFAVLEQRSLGELPGNI